jgi:hypothetical protein
MNKACIAFDKCEKYIKKLYLRNLKRLNNFGDLGVGKGIILKWIFKMALCECELTSSGSR